MGKWQRLSSKIVYHNAYLSVHEDEAINPHGKAVSYGWVETQPAVFIIAINQHNQVCLVEQERYITGRLSWEVPAGSTDGEDELEAAKRELAEEAGLHADHWERLPGDINPYNTLAAERNIYYIAKQLHKVREPLGDKDDLITGQRWVSWDEAKELMRTAEITDGQTLAGLALAALHLGELK